jgi:hypothetical protein
MVLYKRFFFRNFRWCDRQQFDQESLFSVEENIFPCYTHRNSKNNISIQQT